MKFSQLKYAVVCIAIALSAGSCNDVVNMDEGWDPDLVSTGAPVIRKITASSDTTTVISTAALNQSIAVFGKNLTGLKTVMINDLELDLSQVYAKSHRLELVIPRKLPGEVNNTLRIVTKLGETSAELNVVLPELSISGFKNEFAADLDTVQIAGRDFDLYMIDSLNAKLTFNGQPIKMIDCNSNSFSIQIPDGTPVDQTSYLTVETPELTTPVQIPFRETGIPILSNDERTWQGGPWWATGIVEVNEDSDPAAPMFKYYIPVKFSNMGAWSYENVLLSHFWLDDSAADLLENPENWCVKMEICNPAGTPLAKWIRLGATESENANMFYMWDPANNNNGVSLNTMGLWQTVQFEVADLFPPLSENDGKTCLKIAKQPYVNTDEFNNFKVAMQRESPGDVEFYFWNLRFVKKIVTK